jgi:cell division topological specificity factor
MGWLSKLFNLELDSKDSSRPYSAAFGRNGSQSDNGSGSKQGGKQGSDGSKNDAYNRLKLVLMHDRTQISPDVLSKMRDELVQVISKYVDIDREALELNLETESNTIALVANIPVMRMKTPVTSETTEPATTSSTTTTESVPAVATTSLEEVATVAAATTEGATPPAVISQPLLTAPQPTLKAPVTAAAATTSTASNASKPNPFGETPTTTGSSSLHPKSVAAPVTTGPKTPVATP